MKILVTGAAASLAGALRVRPGAGPGRAGATVGWAEGVEHLVRRGAELIQGDLSDPELTRSGAPTLRPRSIAPGAVGVWGRYQDFHQGNVQVTENVVEACLKQRVRRLVHLSSPSIYFDGRDHLGLTEEQVPKRFKSILTLPRNTWLNKRFSALRNSASKPWPCARVS